MPTQTASHGAGKLPESVRIYHRAASRCHAKGDLPASIFRDRRGRRSRCVAHEHLDLALRPTLSHVPTGSKPFKRVLCLLILSASTPLRNPGMAQLLDNLRNGACARLNWFRTGCAAQTTIPHPVPGEVKINDLDPLAVDVLPHVYFSPVQQRMNADVRPRIKVGLKLVPQFRRLILKIPLEVFVAWREISFFCPGSFFVTPNANNDSLIVFFFNNRL